MLGWVIYSVDSFKSHAFDWMAKEAFECGVVLKLYFDNEICFNNGFLTVKDEKVVELPDFVLMRGYCFELSLGFEGLGVRVFNSTASMMLSENKMLCYHKFYGEGLPQPLTFENIDCYARAVELLSSSKFILKSCVGSKGEKVWLVGDKQEFDAAKGLCEGSYIVQSYISESCGRDIRVWVVGDRAVAAVERYNSSSFKSNIFSGGVATIEGVTPELERICVAATKSVGLDFSGVDILKAGGSDEFGGFDRCDSEKYSGKYLICEINGNAGFRSAASTSQGAGLLKSMFEYIVESSIVDK